MRQTITFNDKRKKKQASSEDGRNRQDIRLEILATELPGDCSSFTVDITDAAPAAKKKKPGTVTFTLERETGKTETYTFPREKDGGYKADWFSRIETVASDAPMEYSEARFSVCDTLNDIVAEDRAFRIMADAIYSMKGIKMTKDLAAMMGSRTLLELAAALDSAGGSGSGAKVPENALQILNAELNKIPKKC